MHNLIVDNVSIRQAKVSDLSELSNVAKITFKTTFEKYYNQQDLEELVEAMFTVKELEKYDTFVAVHNNCIVGYYQQLYCNTDYFPNQETIQLKRFYVTTEWIGSGLAQKMMHHFLQQEGKLFWLSVFGDNKRAQKFYKKFGFVHKQGAELVFSNCLLLDGSRDVDIIFYIPRE